jgi:membrane protease YdiL (CAAX protease family)
LSADEILLTLILVFVIGAVVALANYADLTDSRRLHRVLNGLWTFFNGMILLVGVTNVWSAYAANSSDAPSKTAGWGGLLASIVVSGAASLVLLRPVRLKLMVLWKKKTETAFAAEDPPATLSPEVRPQPDGTPLFPQMLNYYTADSMIILRSSAEPVIPETTGTTEAHSFNPDSNVHTAALVLCLYLVGSQIISFILGGGLEGVAQSYKGGLTAWDLLLNAFPLVVIPILGIGLGMRRNVWQALKRLGLGAPTFEGLMVSSAAIIGLFIFVVMLSAIWMGLVSEETFKQQTEASDAISNSVSSIGLAFVLAMTAAVGEEIAFRGALQPIFGLWPTAIIFTLTHVQYTLTPAALIILGVALVFGWIRQRYNTTTAMIVHFFYDFIPLAIGVAVSEGALAWLLRLL